jgi:hypothetical protein
MKTRPHHNTDGREQIRSGRTERVVQRIARKLRVPYQSKAQRKKQRPAPSSALGKPKLTRLTGS